MITNPLVTVLVTHHINDNDPYLELCLKSLKGSIGIPFEIICISDALERPICDFSGVQLVHNRELVTVAQKWKRAMELAHSESKYFMMVSDDVMVSKHTITGLAAAITNREIILGPMSNCDATTRYYAAPAVQNEKGELKYLPVKMSREDLFGFEDAIINYKPGDPILIDPGWISFYCVMMPKSVISKVGQMDSSLEVRWNDVDYCQRARRHGIPSLIHLGVFALHFGDRTIPKVTTAAQYAAADQAFQEKYRPRDEESGDLL